MQYFSITQQVDGQAINSMDRFINLANELDKRIAEIHRPSTVPASNSLTDRLDVRKSLILILKIYVNVNLHTRQWEHAQI